MKIIKVLIFITTIVLFVFYSTATEFSEKNEKKYDQVTIGPKKSVKEMPIGIHKNENGIYW